MKKIATAYKNRTSLFFHSCSHTATGVWIASPPFVKVAVSDPWEAKGQAVLSVLTASAGPVPHPKQEEWGNVFAPMLDLAEATSLSAFERDATCCGLEIDAGELRLIPNRRRKGYIEIPDRAIKLDLASPNAAIGAALDDAFARCE
jgi:hypothetical protein